MVEEELVSQLDCERCVLCVRGLLICLGHALEVVRQSLQSPDQLILTNLLIDLETETTTSALTGEFEGLLPLYTPGGRSQSRWTSFLTSWLWWLARPGFPPRTKSEISNN